MILNRAFILSIFSLILICYFIRKQKAKALFSENFFRPINSINDFWVVILKTNFPYFTEIPADAFTIQQLVGIVKKFFGSNDFFTQLIINRYYLLLAQFPIQDARCNLLLKHPTRWNFYWFLFSFWYLPFYDRLNRNQESLQSKFMIWIEVWYFKKAVQFCQNLWK